MRGLGLEVKGTLGNDLESLNRRDGAYSFNAQSGFRSGMSVGRS
jgi:hypothetical protein